MSEAYLLIGGNIGDRITNLEKAILSIEVSCGELIKSSSIYETAAWGNNDQPDFLNQVLLIKTILAPQHLMKAILEIELNLGRVRHEKNGARLIDIDILYFDDIIIDEPGLNIPHPRISSRRFVLEPLSEIAGTFNDPVSKKTVNSILKECTDPLSVKKYL
jgi:2-amino-4-hydroxy-6-hydroxymethyldihydropteridine diphosphokinase